MKDIFPVLREDKVEVKDSLFNFSITGSSKSKITKEKPKREILRNLTSHWVGEHWQAAWGGCGPFVTLPSLRTGTAKT